MAENNGLWFWQRYAGVYDLVMKRDRKAYENLGSLIRSVISFENEVLELAAGTGLIAEHVAEYCRKYIFTDYSENMLMKAKRKSWPQTVSFEQADVTALRYENKSFDAVIISNALHIIPDPKLALDNIRRVLKKDGKLIAPTFVRYGKYKESLLEKPMQWLGFRSWSTWSPTEYIKFLEENGWQIIESKVIHASFDIAFVVAQ